MQTDRNTAGTLAPVRRDELRTGSTRAARRKNDGRRAVDLVLSQQADIALLDVEMPVILDLPIPAEPMTLAQLREAHPLVDRSASRSPGTQAHSSGPSRRKSNETGELSELLPDGALRTYHLNVVPLRDPDGRFLGVASFMTVLAETRPSMSEVNADSLRSRGDC